MNIIFLDIDGVLNEASSKSRSPMGFIGIDQSKVRRLKRIVDATDAKIVLVSTWKKGWEPNLHENKMDPDTIYMLQSLSSEGVQLLDRTYDNISDRGAGISRWLAQHPDVENFVILDDDVFPDYATYLLTKHHVKTNFGSGGLKDKHVAKAISILQNGA